MGEEIKLWRYKLILQYCGTDYSGWQIQPHSPSVQQTLADAIRTIAPATTRDIYLAGSGRTDAGVHAWAQVAHFDLDIEFSGEVLSRALNAVLPNSIRVVRASRVGFDFHARKSAKKKIYRYVIQNGPFACPLYANRAWHIFARTDEPDGSRWRERFPPLDKDALKASTELIVGTHDFKSFQGSRSDTQTTIREIHWAKWQVTWDPCSSSEILTFRVCGNGFLKQMVRNLVGTLVEVGLGDRSSADMQRILQSGDRRQAGKTAPPHGLYLERVDY